MKINSISIIVLVIVLSGMLIIADNIDIAYASNIITYDLSASTTNGLPLVIHDDDDDNLLVADNSIGIRVYDYDGTIGDTPTLERTISSTQIFQYVFPFGSTYIWVDTSSAIVQTDNTNTFVSRSVVASVECTDTIQNGVNGDLFCVDNANDAIDQWALGLATITETNGSTLNGGAFPCDGPLLLASDSIDNILFVACDLTTNKIISIKTVSESTGGFANVDSEFNITITTGAMDIDSEHNRLLYCTGDASSICTLFSYSSVDGSLTQLDSFTLTGHTTSTGRIQYDANHDRFMVQDPSGEIKMIDTFDGDVLDTVVFDSSTAGRIQIFSSNQFWIGTGDPPQNVYRFDNFGLLDGFNGAGGTGGSGSTGGDTVGGIDCSLPENANILICRLGGDNNFGGIGNSTGTGLLNLGCNIVFVDCTNTNPQTNGLGLLAFIASLFVIIGMFYYTIGKEAFHMPIFIWIVIVIALSAFFTIAGWIDPVFLVLTIVALVALAVPKIMNIVRGSGSTLGEGSSA